MLGDIIFLNDLELIGCIWLDSRESELFIENHGGVEVVIAAFPGEGVQCGAFVLRFLQLAGGFTYHKVGVVSVFLHHEVDFGLERLVVNVKHLLPALLLLFLRLVLSSLSVVV